jgi:carbamoyl-phosphate synthase large subunit
MSGSTFEVTVAVTGMNATDNPAPGVAVARSLRHDPSFRGRIVGLGYDALDPGFYTEGLLDAGAILPYPSAGREALRAHLMRLRREHGIDVFLPTLDSELRAAIALAPDLEAAGIRTFLPGLDSLERASKPRLFALHDGETVRVPESEAVTTADAVPKVVRRLGLPVVIKGPFYGADIVHTEADALASFHRFAASWGVPIILQRRIVGEEYNVAAIGDGHGALIGAVCMRKLALTDKGKGWSGVTVDNPALLQLTAALVATLRWRGPLEVEVLRETESGDLHVIEINPRFPAWIHLSAGAGQNLPLAAVRLALGLPVQRPLPPYEVGKLFVRISLDQIADLQTYERLTALGTLAPREVTQ